MRYWQCWERRLYWINWLINAASGSGTIDKGKINVKERLFSGVWGMHCGGGVERKWRR